METLDGFLDAAPLLPFSDLQNLILMGSEDQDPDTIIRSFLPFAPALKRFQCIPNDDYALANDILPRFPRSIEAIELSGAEVCLTTSIIRPH
jgi:hypothetical protein